MILHVTVPPVQDRVPHYHLTAGLYAAVSESNGGFPLWVGKDMFSNENREGIFK